MSVEDVIARTMGLPPTARSLCSNLRRLGVEPCMTLLVHCSLSALGWVVGGAHAVVLALEDALGPDGTLVMPAHNYGFYSPRVWKNQPVPKEWFQVIEDELPPFDPDLTPTTQMGAVAECFRRQKGTLRSAHPILSVAARGPNAEAITAPESLTDTHGEGSPMARLYELGAWVLLLGVRHDRNTSLHLAERRAKYRPKQYVKRRFLVEQDGEREWLEYVDVHGDSSDFEKLGGEFAAETGLVKTGKVGYADAMLFPQREIVDFGVFWMERHRR